MQTKTSNHREERKHLCQQLSIIEAHCGSTSLGISNLWFMNPTAPITCKYQLNYWSYVWCGVWQAISPFCLKELTNRKTICSIHSSFAMKAKYSKRKNPKDYIQRQLGLFTFLNKYHDEDWSNEMNTCIELRLSQGIFSVASSHITTPKLYTSDLNEPRQQRRCITFKSGA